MTENEKKVLLEEINACECLLIGLGEEWQAKQEPDVETAYNALYRLVKDKDFFVVTTVTDAKIFESAFGGTAGFFAPVKRVSAPCGNDTWKQCSKACTKDIWEAFEVPDGICPHCGEPLVPNTRESDCYIEEGYLPQWNAYTEWLARTLNRKLLVLELGVGFAVPTVVRWPFEKTVFFNQKARLYRIHEKFAQISEELTGKAVSVGENSVKVILSCCQAQENN